MLIASCYLPAGPTSPQGLTVDEHALLGAPTLDPLVFKPAEGSMDGVLAASAAGRTQGFPDNSLLLDGRFSLQTTLGEDTLTATENYNRDSSAGWVTLKRNDWDIYRIDTGMGSPVTALRGLWTSDDHWVLETAYITPDSIGGRIVRDGILLNQALGYKDAFGFQLIAGRPFYFFVKDGRVGFSYDGRETRAGYTELPHYGCCSASELNPRQAQNLVAFFARRDGTWYYVEISASS